MHTFNHLSGVYVAALTPLNEDDTIPLDEVAPFLKFLAQRGCHGALLMGTTGEGPSFSYSERLELLQAAVRVRQEVPGFRLLVGTGTPSLNETIRLTRAAFDTAADGVVVLPPYYFRGASEDGLFRWFGKLIESAVPAGAALFGYHIPSMTGVPLTLDLLRRLKDAYPDRFAGIKDSSGDAEQARSLGQAFGADLLMLSGTDSLFGLALDSGAGGCITAMANLRSPDLRLVWEARRPESRVSRLAADAAQERLTIARKVMGRYPPNPPLYKALLAQFHPFRRWAVRLPLLPLPDDQVQRAVREALAEVGDEFGG